MSLARSASYMQRSQAGGVRVFRKEASEIQQSRLWVEVEDGQALVQL